MRIVDRYDVVLLDLDGVLFRGDQSVSGGPETLAALRADGIRLAFVTNNSARTPEQVADKLVGHGYVARPDEVVTSALATADLLATSGVTEAFVVGEDGIRQALAEAGIAVLEGEPAAAPCVVIGWDREVTYERLKTASLLVERGARLVATNADRSYPAPDGFWPGAGALLAVVTTTTGVEPEVVGKPHPPLYLAALRRVGGQRPLVVGDRLETDIAGALALGWDSLLVLSGATSREMAAASETRPTYVAADVRALLLDPAPQE
ncbi:MAG: HAD-IIA family hydrolase [Actinomycetota bacterium]